MIGEKDRLIIAQNVLNRANDLAIAGKIGLDEVFHYANCFEVWVLKAIERDGKYDFSNTKLVKEEPVKEVAEPLVKL